MLFFFKRTIKIEKFVRRWIKQSREDMIAILNSEDNIILNSEEFSKSEEN